MFCLFIRTLTTVIKTFMVLNMVSKEMFTLFIRTLTTVITTFIVLNMVSKERPHQHYFFKWNCFSPKQTKYTPMNLNKKCFKKSATCETLIAIALIESNLHPFWQGFLSQSYVLYACLSCFLFCFFERKGGGGEGGIHYLARQMGGYHSRRDWATTKLQFDLERVHHFCTLPVPKQTALGIRFVNVWSFQRDSWGLDGLDVRVLGPCGTFATIYLHQRLCMTDI